MRIARIERILAAVQIATDSWQHDRLLDVTWSWSWSVIYGMLSMLWSGGMGRRILTVGVVNDSSCNRVFFYVMAFRSSVSFGLWSTCSS
jgi:hypothetical protein